MTREEASRRIQDLRRKVEKPKYRALGWLETWIYKEDIEALDLAIKALEQEPKTGHWIRSRKMEVTINISMGTKDYEFYNVPEKVGKAIITLLYECENDDSKICSAESER